MATPLTGVILDEDTFQAVPFFSWEPPRYTRNPNYDDVPIRGRSEPHVFYSHTDARIWNFEIHLAVGLGVIAELPIPGVLSAISGYGNPAAVRAAENFIQSLVMPDYGSEVGSFAVVKNPHLTRVAINTSIDARGTMRNLNVAHALPYDIITGLPYRVDISFDIYEQKPENVDPDGYIDVRLGTPNIF